MSKLNSRFVLATWEWLLLAYVACWFAVWFIILNQEIRSMIAVWAASNTYTHCFFVFPASLYFLWAQRHGARYIERTWSVLGCVFTFSAVLVWAVGYAGDIQFFTHVAAVSLIPFIALSLFGFAVLRFLWFPFVFVLFAIPFGDELVPRFQEVTADISVFGLKLIGIPVFRDGLYISLPNGKFEVAEACSGIRFFIATICFSVLYAHLTYTSLKKRLFFLAIAVVVPIIANGLRALGIMLIGYYTNMEHAVGADHLVYGWGFFAFIILLLVIIGDRWKDPRPERQDDKGAEINLSWGVLNAKLLWCFSVIPLCIILGWKLYIDETRNHANKLPKPSLSFIREDVISTSVWQPQFVGSDWGVSGKMYPKTEMTLFSAGMDVFLSYYTGKPGEAELISWQNRVYRPDMWSAAGSGSKHFEVEGLTLQISWFDLRSLSGRQRLVYYWYIVPGLKHGDRLRIKAMQALNALAGRSAAGGFIAFSTVYPLGAKGDAEVFLQKGIAEFYPRIVNDVFASLEKNANQ